MSGAIATVSLARVDAPWPPAGTTAIDKAGRTVDISGSVWRLSSGSSEFNLDWSTINIPQIAVFNAIRRYFADLIARQRPQSVANAFRGLSVPLATKAFREAMLGNGEIPFLVFSEARATLGDERDYLLHYWRQLYQWCALRGYSRFTRKVSHKLADQVIGGNTRARAVRSADPNKGPLTDSETFALTNALRAAKIDRSISVAEQAALWLCLTCGANTSQYTSLREEDLVPMTLNGERVGWILRVPRHKKGDALERVQFKPRKLQEMPAAAILALIEENREKYPPDGGVRPLFRRKKPASPDSAIDPEWAWHMKVTSFGTLIQAAVSKLNVDSYLGDPLAVSPRRFRYTLATRLVASGASKYAVAEALDHSSLQYVDTYFDVAANIVDILDSAMALALAPRAQAFIVEREEDAVRGTVKGSRCHYSNPETQTHEPIGTCGNSSFCNVIGPLACYTCRRFQPWLDGPHEEVLDYLIERRDSRRALGLDEKLVAIEDNVILAVAGVVNRISEIHLQRAIND